MTSYVYCILNKINNKLYIGKSNNPKNRWRQHKYLSLNMSNDCPKLYNAIRKYGKDNFIHIILEEFISEIDALKAETYYIKIFNSIEFGYNCFEDISCRIGYVASDETRKKISIAKTGTVHSEETKKKMSIAHFGKYVSQETRDKMAIAKRNRVVKDETKQKLSIAHKGKRLSPLTEFKPGCEPPVKKITKQMAEDIINKYTSGNFSQRALAKEYKVAKTTIANVIKNKYNYNK